MLRKSKIWGSVISLGSLLGLASGVKAAEEMPSQLSEQTSQARQIVQPLGVKVAVTIGGVGLIALELWWFLWSQTSSQQAKSDAELK